MFGLTTPCVQAVCKQLEARYDCLVFHATGTGGQAMEKLADSGLLAGVLDVTTTEVADEIVGGVLTAGPDAHGRLREDARSPTSAPAAPLDMVNFWAYGHGARRSSRTATCTGTTRNVTLMRTTPEEAARIGRFIVDKLNRMEGPVRFLIPEGGLSGLDRPGGPFWDPAANKACSTSSPRTSAPAANRKLLEAARTTSTTRRSPTRWSPTSTRSPDPMARIARTGHPDEAARAWCAAASRSSAAAPAPACPPSARRPAASTSS